MVRRGEAAPYTPSRCSREAREEGGIPKLEEEDDVVVVKEVSSECPVPGVRGRRNSLDGMSGSFAKDNTNDSVVDKGVAAGGGVARQQAPAQSPVPPVHRQSYQSTHVAGKIKAQFAPAAVAVWALAPIQGGATSTIAGAQYTMSKRFVKIMVRFVKIWECRSPDQNILYSICEDMGV